MEEKKHLEKTPDASYYQKQEGYAYLHVFGIFIFFIFILIFSKNVHSIFFSVFIYILMGFVLYHLYFPLHDCSHYSLFGKKKTNQFFGFVLASLLFTSFDSFRREHIQHHKDYGTKDDPGSIDYWVRFRSRREMAWFFISAFCGVTVLSKIKNLYFYLFQSKLEKKNTVSSKIGFLIFIVIQFSVFFYLSNGFKEIWRYFIFYILPILTLFLGLSRLRMFLEHASLDYSQFDYFISPRLTARTILSNPIEKEFFCDMNFNYHYEHHQFPQIPSCNLKRLHENITGPFINKIDFEKTYSGAFTKLWRYLGKQNSY